MVIAMLLIAGSIQAQSKQKKDKAPKKPKAEMIKLFNGKDLGNWTFFLKDPAVDPAKVFFVQDGVIHVTGNPFGYMRTRESYSNYTLTLEWRWPAEATNSGVFVNVQLPDSIWPKCVECQLKAGSAGDFVCMSGTDMNERRDKAVRSVKKLAESSEKPAGEWNKMEVTCISNTITVYVNRVLQNKATGLNVNSGHICLQSEGKDLEFRNVVLAKHKK